MNDAVLILLPNGRFQIGVPGKEELSPAAPFDQPIVYEGYIGFTEYWGIMLAGVHRLERVPSDQIDSTLKAWQSL